MGNPFFKYKDFVVYQDRCAMKVTTDSIVLGTRVKAPAEATTALDIGTGTGIVALCLAQRFSNLHVDAIEIDPQAAQQASENFSASPYASRLIAICQDVRNYQPEKRYDLIVSNPPYYSNPLKSPDPQRDIARGDTGLTFESLTTKIAELLAPHGVATIIIPTESVEKFCKIAQEKGLFLRKRIDIFPNFDSPSKRVVLTFSPACAGRVGGNPALQLSFFVPKKESLAKKKMLPAVLRKERRKEKVQQKNFWNDF